MDFEKGEMIGQGNTAEIYKLQDQKILKLFRHGLNKGIVDIEYQNGISVQKNLDCVPKAYEMVMVNDRHGIVYEEIKGKDMLQIMLTKLWKVHDSAKEFAHYHLSIQKPITDNLCTVKTKLEEDLKHVNVLSDENKEIVQNYLTQLPDGSELCHFDFHPGNIMIANDKPVFIDWMTACRGDACADVARTCILLKYGEATNAPWMMKKLISMFRHFIYRAYLKEYLMISKRCMADINKWELPVAAARLGEWISENEKRRLKQLVDEHCDRIVKQ